MAVLITNKVLKERKLHLKKGTSSILLCLILSKLLTQGHGTFLTFRAPTPTANSNIVICHLNDMLVK